MLVQNFLERSAERLPNKTALVCGADRYTYSDINVKANRLANALIEKGVRRGDRVVIYMPNSMEVVVGLFAVLKAGGTFVVVNHTTKRDKLTYILNNCRAAAMLTNHRNIKLVREIFEEVPSLVFSVIAASKKKTVGELEAPL
ncbi:MAG: long-chain fatty acid--CoA ligase, partial [Gammaproteobacteria bacterium]|nr:long-chain fatty acid--CoA ligase [candidate division Zixibacteria bacterium]NIR93592.1 long-chain fatty acid--CoA ligase [Gammaproteobacteria bacterium]NIS46073.1 long-chain fatty acid--CoA ligase [candidate division Zixibacteria bacterium]NIU14193.1 long-chain fatty acid--CoA ligase [candidate division Zixibacteria bacterium]NIV06241.1 AMP-binding protein [candidate division Zixibacteria bacterium]